jgi:hypothetical protein
MMQESIVAVIVAYAVWVVAKRYAPKSLRRALRAWIERTAMRFGWTGIAAKLEAKRQAEAACASGCGACGGCASGDAASAAKKQFTITPEALKRTTTH